MHLSVHDPGASQHLLRLLKLGLRSGTLEGQQSTTGPQQREGPGHKLVERGDRPGGDDRGEQAHLLGPTAVHRDIGQAKEPVVICRVGALWLVRDRWSVTAGERAVVVARARGVRELVPLGRSAGLGAGQYGPTGEVRWS